MALVSDSLGCGPDAEDLAFRLASRPIRSFSLLSPLHPKRTKRRLIRPLGGKRTSALGAKTKRIGSTLLPGCSRVTLLAVALRGVLTPRSHIPVSNANPEAPDCNRLLDAGGWGCRPRQPMPGAMKSGRTSMSGSTTFNYTGSIVTYTVPATGLYDIVADRRAGARIRFELLAEAALAPRSAVTSCSWPGEAA